MKKKKKINQSKRKKKKILRPPSNMQAPLNIYSSVLTSLRSWSKAEGIPSQRDDIGNKVKAFSGHQNAVHAGRGKRSGSKQRERK
jgi:hypothetical protein